MKWTRREIAKLAAGALSLSGCASHLRPEPKLLLSRVPLPHPFSIPLPIIPTLRQSDSDSTTDFYDVTVMPSEGQILPGVKTTFWGYNGMFPGPTIEARSG